MKTIGNILLTIWQHGYWLSYSATPTVAELGHIFAVHKKWALINYILANSYMTIVLLDKTLPVRQIGCTLFAEDGKRWSKRRSCWEIIVRDLAQSVAYWGYRYDASSNPVVDISVKKPSVTLHSLSALVVGCSTDASSWSTVVECNVIGVLARKLLRKLASSLTCGNSLGQAGILAQCTDILDD